MERLEPAEATRGRFCFRDGNDIRRREVMFGQHFRHDLFKCLFSVKVKLSDLVLVLFPSFI